MTTRILVALRFPGTALRLADDPTFVVWRVNPASSCPLGEGPRRYDVALLDAERVDLIQEAHARQIAVIALAEWGTGLEAAYRAGCDTFLTPPVSADEWGAYVRALMRRRNAKEVRIDRSRPVDAAGLQVDPTQAFVTFQGRRVQLSPNEILVLASIVARRGELVPHADLAPVVVTADDPTQAVRQTVWRIRRRFLAEQLDDPIELVYGHGYRLRIAS